MAKHKPITVSSVAYVHIEDVDVEQHVNAGPSTEAMNVCVARAQTALDAPAGEYSELHRANMQNVFTSMQSTHHAIRKLLKWGDEEPVAIDALAFPRARYPRSITFGTTWVPFSAGNSVASVFTYVNWPSCQTARTRNGFSYLGVP